MRKSMGVLVNKVSGIRGDISAGTETHLRNDIHSFSQKQHLASTIFSLDEIAIEPRVLTPTIQAPRSMDLAPTDSVSLTVPYIPDWPELAAVYKASTMTLIEALQGGSNIILAGHPGSGKTVALAWLASFMARNDKGLGKLAGFLPLYIHATELQFIRDYAGVTIDEAEKADQDITELSAQQPHLKPQVAKDVVGLLTQAIASYATPVTISRLPRIVQSALDNQRAILIIDRVDELPPKYTHLIADFFTRLLEKYPKLRIVVAMSYDYMAGLPSMGFGVIAMAAWDEDERHKLLQKWSQQWVKYVAPMDKNSSKKINPYFLKGWLSANNDLLKPLEYTLKVWAAFCGDILGADGPSAIEAYIRRMTNQANNTRPELERFALQLLVEMDYASNPRSTKRLISAYEASIKALKEKSPSNEGNYPQEPAEKIPYFKDIPEIDLLSSNGFLISYSNYRFGFSHPMITGYLAGKALSEIKVASQIQDQPSWSGKNLALYYFSRYGDVTPQIQYYLQEDNILHANHLIIARWLQVAPKNRPWRTIILRTLASVMMKEKETLSLAAKIITAMAFSGDEGVSLYFRQLLKSEHPNLKQLAALGCGILADKKAIGDLNLIFQEQSPASIRSASLALAAISDNQALEILAANLLSGDELVRRCAAEALANNQKEGYPALKDGSAMEDVLVRRSVIFGLIRIDQPWARKIVENLQLEDKEWIVRNAAIQVFDELHRKTNLAPQPLPFLTEATWLINYANKIGTTVAPGKPGEELVGKALANGTNDEKLNALDYFRNKCDPATINLIYTTYKNSTGEVHDATYQVLWLMTAAGIKLPYTFE